jgi:hypothetical protein
MRHYVIIRGGPAGAWVVCETPDESMAEEIASTFLDALVLTQAEASLDPDFQPAARAWEDGDDSVWRRIRDEADAYEVVEEIWEDYLADEGDAALAGEDPADDD